MDAKTRDLVDRGFESQWIDDAACQGIRADWVVDHMDRDEIFTVLDEIALDKKLVFTEGHTETRVGEGIPGAINRALLGLDRAAFLLGEAGGFPIEEGMRHEARTDDCGGKHIDNAGGVRIITDEIGRALDDALPFVSLLLAGEEALRDPLLHGAGTFRRGLPYRITRIRNEGLIVRAIKERSGEGRR